MLAALLVGACATVDGPGDRASEATRGDAVREGDSTPRSPGAPAEAPPRSPGAPLPAVPLRTLDDQPMRLEAAAGGKVALVSFWATWCESCAAEMDALNRLDDRARASGGVVIGVAVGEAREKAAQFARQRGLKYAQLVDEKLELADALGQKRLPATLVLDRQGRVVFAGGALDEKALAAFRSAMGR